MTGGNGLFDGGGFEVIAGGFKGQVAHGCSFGLLAGP
jgi:hypothetical protein